MSEILENKENNQKAYNLKTIFGNFLNTIPDKKPLNIKDVMKKENKELKKLLNKGISSNLINRKPSPLKLLEKQMSNFFFGINGKLTYLIPHLQNELIKKEKNQEKILNEKISIGELTFLQNKSYDNKGKKKEENRNFLLKSTNFITEKNYYKEQKRNKKIFSQNNINFNLDKINLLNEIINSQYNKNRINDFLLTINKFNLHSENNEIQKNKNITNKSNNNLQRKKKIKTRNYSDLNEINSTSPITNNEKKEENTLTKNKNSFLSSSKETNVNQINTLTTSINSKSNNSLSNNPISSFKMSKSSIKTSSFSTHPVNNNNLNNFNNENVSNSIYLKNAIANINFDDNKKAKKNQINLLTVSNSQKQLLIPEYSVEKPFIMNSYLNFHKKNPTQSNLNLPIINKEKNLFDNMNNNNNNNNNDNNNNYNNKDNINNYTNNVHNNNNNNDNNSVNIKINNNIKNIKKNSLNSIKNCFNNKNRKELNSKLEKIITNEKKISKSLQKIINKNKINKKIKKILNKNSNETIIKKDIPKFKLDLEDNMKKEKKVKLLNTERIENDNKLIDATKKLSDDAIIKVLVNAKKTKKDRNRNLSINLLKNEKYEIWKEKFVDNNSYTIQCLNAALEKEKNKFIQMVHHNLNKNKNDNNDNNQVIKVNLRNKKNKEN